MSSPTTVTFPWGFASARTISAWIAFHVLVLVDQQVVVLIGEPPADAGRAQGRVPVEEEVVEVERVEFPLAPGVCAEQGSDLGAVVGAPREGLGENLGQFALGVDRARVDVVQR
jgi:hypothetical protein